MCVCVCEFVSNKRVKKDVSRCVVMTLLEFHNTRYFPRQRKEKKGVKRALFPSFSLFLHGGLFCVRGRCGDENTHKSHKMKTYYILVVKILLLFDCTKTKRNVAFFEHLRSDI